MRYFWKFFILVDYRITSGRVCEVSGSFSGINGRVTFQTVVIVRACVAQMLEATLRTSAVRSME